MCISIQKVAVGCSKPLHSPSWTYSVQKAINPQASCALVLPLFALSPKISKNTIKNQKEPRITMLDIGHFAILYHMSSDQNLAVLGDYTTQLPVV